MPEHGPLGKDKLKKAVHYFAELVASHPEKSRLELLQKVELQFDLSPADCEFLNKHLANEEPKNHGMA
ncbi:MAG: hypothetical protein HKP52_06445 [Desulfofustis sp.]|nr:hypothetical protein [Desulfofustis sp.]NNK13858.1 hypothetical protein [Desulfofustis sp.]